MFNDSVSHGFLSPTLTEASITLLLKPGKDNTECSSYRPSSTVTWRSWPRPFLTLRNHNAWRGLCWPDWFYFWGVIHLQISADSNIIHSPAPSTIPEVVIALDAEKAFDRVEWKYLFTCLRKFGYGPNLISWISLWYTSPRASVITNGKRSQYFQLPRGTRQGCPISPLLFALAIEPLSITLKSLALLSGIHREGEEHRVSLYADDLLCMHQTLFQVPPMWSVLWCFFRVKLNSSKNECYPVNDLTLQIQNNALPFHVSSNGFRYLGINITITRAYSVLLKRTSRPPHWLRVIKAVV